MNHAIILKSRIQLIVTLPLMVAAILLPVTAKSDMADPRIAPPQHYYKGLSYQDWSVKWFKYANSLPLANHPLNDTADCSTGQKGDVWFLDGPLAGPYPAEGRDCTVPPGTAIFFTLKAASWDNEGCSADKKHIQKTNLTESQLRANAQNDLIGNYGFRKIIIDGKEVKGLPTACIPANPASCQSPYRVQTPVFDYKVPALDNTLIFFNGACYNDPNHGRPYQATGAVGDGYHVMIKPLSYGKHTLRFGSLDSNGKPIRLYNITVSKQHHKHEAERSKKGFN